MKIKALGHVVIFLNIFNNSIWPGRCVRNDVNDDGTEDDVERNLLLGENENLRLLDFPHKIYREIYVNVRMRNILLVESTSMRWLLGTECPQCVYSKKRTRHTHREYCRLCRWHAIFFQSYVCFVYFI